MNYTNAQITERRDADLPDAKDVQVVRAYAEGAHPEVLTNKQSKLLQGRTAHRMIDNILDLVLKTTAARLQLTEWAILGETPVNLRTGQAVGEKAVDAIKGYLDSVWLLNRVARLQYEVHYATLRDGNSAVSMAWRNGRVHLWREPWWDGTTGMYVAYTDAGEYEFAVKEWNQRNPDGKVVKRRTIYEPGLIYRWVENGDGWTEYDGDGTVSPVEPVTRTRSGEAVPMPIPVVHFVNGAAVLDGPYGTSDIANLLALQDDINATQRDISAAALMAAFQRIFVSGTTIKNLALEPGGVFGDEKADAKLTVIEPGDPAALIAVHNHKRQAISTNSRTPMHVITGEWPSGVALLQSSMGQIEKVEAAASMVGPQWTMVAHRAVEMANAFGRADLDEDVPITSRFAAAERIDDLTRLQIKQAEADYWETIARLPKEAMLQAGIDETTATQIVKDREAMGGVIAEAGF